MRKNFSKEAIMREIKIDSKNSGQRLDKFLMKYLNAAPKSFIYKMLRKKNIKLNGKKAEGSEIVGSGDILELFLADDTISGFQKEIGVSSNITPDIVYEDENIIIANKPVGLLVQGDSSGGDNLNDALVAYLLQKGEISALFKPGIANRLDRNTGGLVLMGKNLAASQALSEAIRNNDIEKNYITAVVGSIDESGEIRGFHSKDCNNKVLITKHKREGAAEVRTLYTPLHTGSRYTVLKVGLITGRSHQIRESFNSIGCPVIGDPKYGDKEANRFFRQKFGLDHQLLYAVSVKLHSQKGILGYLNEKVFECSPDKTARAVLEYIKNTRT